MTTRDTAGTAERSLARAGPSELIVHILQSCDSTRDVLALVSTRRHVCEAWRANVVAALLPRWLLEIPHFRDAVLAVSLYLLGSPYTFQIPGCLGIDMSWTAGHAENMEVHQSFLFTNDGPINRAPKVILIDCLYGGVDVISQVTMTSPLEPISIGDIINTKDALDMEDLCPAASAIEKALGRDGGAMVAGMAAAGMTSLEMWDYLGGQTLELHAAGTPGQRSRIPFLLPRPSEGCC
jgi:hypothetical protein